MITEKAPLARGFCYVFNKLIDLFGCLIFVNRKKFIAINDAYLVCVYPVRVKWRASNDANAVSIAYIGRGLLATGVRVWLEDEIIKCYIHIL